MGPSFGTSREERIQGFQVFKETIKFTSEGGGKGGGGRCSKCLLQMDVVEANTNFSKTEKRSK